MSWISSFHTLFSFICISPCFHVRDEIKLQEILVFINKQDNSKLYEIRQKEEREGKYFEPIIKL